MFGKNAKAREIPIRLGQDAPPSAVRKGSGLIGEERLLAVGSVTRGQSRRGRVAELVPRGAGDTDPEPVDPFRGRFFKRLDEYASGNIFIIVGVRFIAGGIGHAV